jgi:acetyl-CoA carboxylase alpha subunit
MLESINTCETGVHQKTLNRLVKFIEQFKQLNFVDDQEMERQLEAVRKELLSRTAEEYRDSTKARNQLLTRLCLRPTRLDGFGLSRGCVASGRLVGLRQSPVS